MSIGIAGSTNARVLAALAADARMDEQLPPSFKDGQGREFKLQTDPVTGHPQYRHAAVQSDASGARLDTEILIDLQPDGGFTRRTTQELVRPGGVSQYERVLETRDPQGVQTGELVETRTTEPGNVTTERTTGTFAQGVQVGRETDIHRVQEQRDASGEQVRIELRVHGTWSEGGAPITDATVPRIERQETQTITTPGGGLHKDTPRVLTLSMRSTGTPGAMQQDGKAKLVVRFEGRGEQYLERELAVPMGADGQLDMANAETVRETDAQSVVAKGMMQARIWGGLVSNLAWIGGVLTRGRAPSTPLLLTSVGAAGAQTIGEGHALLTRRNDGDGTRFAMTLYDTAISATMVGLVLSRGRQIAELPAGTRLALGTAAIAPSIAMHAQHGLRPEATSNGMGTSDAARDVLAADVQAAAGAALAVNDERAAKPLDRERFDAVAALI